MKKIYLKVYQNKNSLDIFFVENLENFKILLLCEQIEIKENEDYLPLIFEPIVMSEKEFEKLPKFTGF